MSAHFTSPPARMAYFELVWQVVRQVPPGCVTTYGRIASYLPSPPGMSERAYAARGARMVGGAMAACPADVPWQRVINAQGKISLRRGDGGEEQRKLLEAEGVEFDEQDRVDLSRYLWEAPGEDQHSAG